MVGVSAVLLVLIIAVTGIQLGAAIATRHRAESAADLAALAAAAQVVAGADAACGAAERVTGRMSTRLADCELDGWTVTVRVQAVPPGLIGRFGVAHGTARAGPVEEDPARVVPVRGVRQR